MDYLRPKKISALFGWFVHFYCPSNINWEEMAKNIKKRKHFQMQLLQSADA